MNNKITKPLSKSELAALWGIHVATLRRWMNSHSELQQQLAQTGFQYRQRILTIRQLEIIISFFG